MSAHVFRPFSKVMLLMALDEQGLEPARDELAAAFETIERCPFDELIWARMWDIDEYSLVFARRPPASAGRVRR